MSDTTQTIQVEALDTLFFRDGKPFSMGEDTWADGIFPPPPSVIYGALRTAYFAENPKEFYLANSENDPTKDLKIKGIFYSQQEDEYWFPIPLDLVKEKNSQSNNCFLNINKVETNSNTIISNHPLNYLNIQEKTIESVSGFLNNYELTEYIKANKEKFDFENKEKFISIEPKVGIKRSNNTLNTEDGNLYRVGQLRLKNDLNSESFKINVKFHFQNKIINTRFIKFGAEGKIASIRQKELFEIPKPEKFKKYFKLLFLSPAIFKYGWLPNKIENDFSISLSSIKLKLLMAFVGKEQFIGGFDMKSVKHKFKGYPKPMYKAIPAGSVFYFENIDNTDYDKIIDLFHCKNISDKYANQGYGFSVVANLNF